MYISKLVVAYISCKSFTLILKPKILIKRAL